MNTGDIFLTSPLGTEHHADTNTPAHPSYCNLPLFHHPLPAGQAPPGGIGYISRDGHHFSCRNPALMQQAFQMYVNQTSLCSDQFSRAFTACSWWTGANTMDFVGLVVTFLIDDFSRSGSMSGRDRSPLPNTPVTNQIVARHNNRVGAVYSSLYAFWKARDSAVNNGSGGAINRRDAYSVILFDQDVRTVIDNDFTSAPEALLAQVLPVGAGGGTNFTLALRSAQELMENNWSTERFVVVFYQA